MKLILHIFLVLLLVSSCISSPDRTELFNLTDSILDSIPPMDSQDIVENDKSIITKDGKYEVSYFGRTVTVYVRKIYDEYDEMKEYEELTEELTNRYIRDDRVNEVKLNSSQYGYSLKIDCYVPNPIQKEMSINEEFKMEWSSPFGDNLKDIAKIMVRYKLKMCGEFYYKESIQDPNKKLISCTPDGKSFNVFIVNTLGDGWIESLKDDQKAKLKKPY
ncbi:MAG: hypothetical protein KA264_09555 [Crocinitomicaceae bacterium]|nr:hypothetical protein [Crocinitomicaceae bacterium]